MMKKLLGLLTILAVLGSTSTIFASYVAQNHLHLYLGLKGLYQYDWEPTADHLEYAVNGDFNINNLPFNISFSYSYSEDYGFDEGVAVALATSEFRVGARKYLLTKNVEFLTKNDEFSWFFGGGLSHINAKASISILTLEDSSIGCYVELGSQYKFNNKFHMGTKIAFSFAEIKLDGDEYEVGGSHIGLFINIPFKLK
tara:strand:- start:49 stop:642 length:594 start_codon:yes stop_codon:yes gene_type:complete